MRYLAAYDGCVGPPDRVSRAIRDFLEGNEETHSFRGLLLHAICNHCVERGIGFTLTFIPATDSYLIKRSP